MNNDTAVHFVSLGCPKNRVDSEVMLGHLNGAGYRAVADAEDADVVVVNTCGFIDAAKEESVDAIVQMADLKTSGRLKTLVVAGCLSQRYAPELALEIPEVDHFLGTGNFETIAQVLGASPLAQEKPRRGLPIVSDTFVAKAPRTHSRLVGRNALVPFQHGTGGDGEIFIPDPDFTLNADSPRMSTQPAHSVYLKVSEGCSNTCSFCIIPKLRGPQRSRPIEDVVREAERLVLAGATELNLIAQDLCAFGRDLTPKQDLAQLLEALDALGERAGRRLWFRCLYAYPKGLTDKVIDVMAKSRHIVPYLDMPLQHISDSMLRRMRRGTGGPATWALVRKLRARLPNLTLRTTFIVGLPGETEADFEELMAFAREIRFEQMGAFVYSRESDTPAASMPDQVPQALAQKRHDLLMRQQAEISRVHQENLVGQIVDVMVTGISDESEYLLAGRHQGQAPDIDGVTFITSGTARPGDIVQVRIKQSANYDVAGPMLGVEDDEGLEDSSDIARSDACRSQHIPTVSRSDLTAAQPVL